jgi:hypothetical protein
MPYPSLTAEQYAAFAAAALQALLTGRTEPVSGASGAKDRSSLARAAFDIADAMKAEWDARAKA